MKTTQYIARLQRWLIPLLIAILAMPALGDEPVKRALLIGIDDYLAVTDLRGAVNDVELVQDILIGKFDMPPENILTLTNDKATRLGILTAIEDHLIAPATEGDVIILHYSGHGSQMRDQPNGDEVDGWDETIVPHDSRSNGVFDITDDELNGMLAKLTAKTKNVTFILDSCHSGAAARDGSRVRKIERDSREPPPAPAFAISTRAGEGDAGIRLNGADYVLISGCLAPELSNETRFGERRHGAMTWFLAEALRAAQPGATYRSVMDSVKTNVTNRFPTQHPQIEGPGMDLGVFGVERINSKPYVLVESVSDNVATLDGGKLMGLEQDGRHPYYTPGTADTDNAEVAGILRIIAVDDFSAQAQLQQGDEIMVGSRVLIGPSDFGQLPTTLYLDQNVDEAYAEIKTALQALPIVEIVESAEEAQLIIGREKNLIAIRTGDLSLASPLVDTASAGYTGEVINRVKDIVHWRALRDLHNPDSRRQINFDIAIKDSNPARLNPATVLPGQRLLYRVQNLEQDVGLYNYVLDVSSDGSVALLYPPSGEQQVLAPGATLQREIEMYLPDGTRSVTDVLKVIATISPIDPSVFPRGPLRTASLQEGTRANTDSLSRFLAGATRGQRGAMNVNADQDNWVTRQRSVTVQRPDVSVSGFTLHFSEPTPTEPLGAALGVTRDVCTDPQPGADSSCLQLRLLDQSGTLLELQSGDSARAATGMQSVGEAFDEAYAIQDQTGAERVEPNLAVDAPGLVDNQGIDKRELFGDDGHDPLAESDDQWSLTLIQAPAAWQKIRDRHQLQPGQEASGVRIAHTDTGYLPHPENWAQVEGIRPIDPTLGYDYYDEDNDPLDPLLNTSKLDNPGHGTASGSVIVSPPGCQMEGQSGCVNGVAPGAQLIPLRVHRTVSQYDTRNLARAIRDVANGNVSGQPGLISTAMGGPPSFNLYRAVKEAEQNGVLMISAAGNFVRTVVWPARFDSTIAVAAVNVRCEPWKHSSRGNKVDISAPGESVWRASLNEAGEFINYMGKGTTFATGNTTAAAALWLSWHRDNPALDRLREQGLITQAFRKALRDSAWRPEAGDTDPPGSHCNGGEWDDTRFGPGIIDISALLDVPIESAVPRSLVPADLEQIPLFASLYSSDAQPGRILADYRALLGAGVGEPLDDINNFETEVMYHYTVDEDVQRTVDSIVEGQRGDEPVQRARAALQKTDISSRLYARLDSSL